MKKEYWEIIDNFVFFLGEFASEEEAENSPNFTGEGAILSREEIIKEYIDLLSDIDAEKVREHIENVLSHIRYDVPGQNGYLCSAEGFYYDILGTDE